MCVDWESAIRAYPEGSPIRLPDGSTAVLAPRLGTLDPEPAPVPASPVPAPSGLAAGEAVRAPAPMGNLLLLGGIGVVLCVVVGWIVLVRRRA